MDSTSKERASWWSITINNPTEEDRNRLAKQNLPSFVKSIRCQDEVGDEGTLHIQGAVNTTQTRFSAMKLWLPRAHIEVARNREALLNYVQKQETAVAGTRQVVIQADYLTMDKALLAIASHQMDFTEWFNTESLENKRKDHAFEKQEYWRAVRLILQNQPKAVGLFTNPQLERAWVNTRGVWIDLLKLDRQTDRQLEDSNNNLPVGYNDPPPAQDGPESQGADFVSS